MVREERRVLEAYLRERGQKMTGPRETVLDAFLRFETRAGESQHELSLFLGCCRSPFCGVISAAGLFFAQPRAVLVEQTDFC